MARQLELDNLPDELHCTIFERSLLSGSAEWAGNVSRSQLLVCRRWRRIVRSDPRFWQQLVLLCGGEFEQLLACYGHEQQLPGGLLHTSRLYIRLIVEPGCPESSLGDVLPLFQQLAQLHIWPLDPLEAMLPARSCANFGYLLAVPDSLWAALHGLASLRHLDISPGEASAQRLAALTQLTQLRLRPDTMLTETCSALGSLSALQSLEVPTLLPEAAVGGQPLAALTALRSLTMLELHIGGGGCRFPSPSAFPSLRCFLFAVMNGPGLPPTSIQLPGVERLARCANWLPPHEVPMFETAAGSPLLLLSGAHTFTSLRALLAACATSASPPSCLVLEHCRLGADASLADCQGLLAPFTSLVFKDSEDTVIETTVVYRLLEQMTNIQSVCMPLGADFFLSEQLCDLLAHSPAMHLRHVECL